MTPPLFVEWSLVATAAWYMVASALLVINLTLTVYRTWSWPDRATKRAIDRVVWRGLSRQWLALLLLLPAYLWIDAYLHPIGGHP